MQPCIQDGGNGPHSPTEALGGTAHPRHRRNSSEVSMASVDTFLSARSESFSSVVSSEGPEYGAHSWMSGSPAAARMPTHKRVAHIVFPKLPPLPLLKLPTVFCNFGESRHSFRAVMAACHFPCAAPIFARRSDVDQYAKDEQVSLMQVDAQYSPLQGSERQRHIYMNVLVAKLFVNLHVSYLWLSTRKRINFHVSRFIHATLGTTCG